MNLLMTNDSLFQNKIVNEAINEIIRGEMGAIESYERILKHVDEDKYTEELNLFLVDHKNSLDYWRNESHRLGCELESYTGIWDKVVGGLVETTSLLGNIPALIAIRESESSGLSMYERLKNSDILKTDHHEAIRKVYIPRQKRHINFLNKMID